MGENINNGQCNIPRFLNSTTKIVAITAILYFLIAKLSLFIFVTEINILPFFPAIGFAIAAMQLLGRKVILGVAIGCLLFSISLYQSDFQNATTFEELIKPLALCIVRPIIASLNILLVSNLSQLWCKSKYPFNSEKNVIFFALACFLGAFISVSIGFITLTITPYFSLDNCILIWSNMLRGNVLGAIIFTPFVLSWLHHTKEFIGWSAVKKVEVFILIIFTLFTTIYIFETRANNESILFFFLIWASCRFGMKIITLVSLIITIIAIYSTGHQMGGFIFSGWNKDFFMLQLFLFVNMVSVLFLKAILEEKKNEESKLKISEQDLDLEKNILKATVESPTGISISSMDNNLNYLSFNSAHSKYMKNEYGVEIKIGDNHIDLIPKGSRKDEIISIFNNVLEGKIYSAEEKDATGAYWNVAKSPIKNEEDKIIGVTTIVTNVTELKLKEIQLEKNNISLNERIKELRCLYDVSEIISNKALSKPKKLEACVQIIPKALQFPEIANCRIQMCEEEFFSANYQQNDWTLKQKIFVNGEEYGFIEIGYYNAKELKKETIFLEEEVKLLQALSDILSRSMERKLAKEKLLKSEESYRILFENVQDVFFKTSIRTGEILDVSPSCSTFNGITREELIGQSMSIIYSDKNQMQLMFQKIITEQKVIDHNNEITINGKLFYVSINAKIIYDSNGEPEFAIGSLRDITERRLIEENLKISEEKFRTIFENTQDVYYMHNLDGKIFEVSPSAEKHFKYKREEMIGFHTGDLYYDKSKQNELREKITRDGIINDEHVQFVTATGEPVYFSVNCKIIFDKDGTPSHVEGSMRNINERITNQIKLEAASQKIKESEEKFRSIYENMHDVYFMHDFDGTLIDISPSAEKNFPSKRENLIGTNVKSFYYDPTRFDELKTKVLENGILNDQEVQFLTTTGETVYYSVSARLINNRNDNRILVEGTMRNINERIINQKKLLEASQKIKKSEEEFRAIFESFEDLYYRVSLDGYIQNVSPSVEKILKYTREEIIGSYAPNLYLNPEERLKLIEALTEKGHVNDFETVLKDKENNPVFLSVNAHFVYDSKGNAICSEGIMRDISQRKKNELEIEMANQTIKENEKKYRTIFESVRDVFFRASAKDHTILDISPSCSYFDLKPEEIIGKSIEEFYLNPLDRQAVLKELIENGEIKNYDIKFLMKNKIYTVSINSKIAYNENNEPEFLIGSFRDVSDTVKAEEKLKISEAKFRSIYENFEDVYYKTKLDGTIIDLSPSFERNFKMKRSEGIGKSTSDFYYNQDDHKRAIKLLRKNGHISDFNAQYVDGEGNVLFFSVNTRIVHDSNGKPIFVEGTMRDVNERSIMQEEMLAKNRTLEFQNTELEQFAYIASHDLQEPLITVIHCIQMLQEELNENLDEDQKQYLQFINSSTARMQLLVKGLLDYSRIGKERKNNCIDCNEIVANVLADMDVSLKESNAFIECENLPVIEGYTTEIRQLFQNMISNANKYRKKDRQPKIKITAVKEENNWLFSIQDNGIGIEEQNKDKIFVIFKRLHNRNEYQGTGIGLSHCKKIVEHHNGKIWVESNYNKGSTFKWTLPVELN